MKRIIAFIYLAFFGALFSVTAQNKIIVGDDFKVASFEKKLKTWIDKDNVGFQKENLEFDKFKIMDRPTLDLGFENSTIWGCFEIENQSVDEKSLILRFRSSFIDTLQVFHLVEDSLRLVGSYNWNQSFVQRPYPDKKPAFEIKLNGQAHKKLVFKIVKKYGSVHVIPTLYDKSYFDGLYSKMLMFQFGIFFGIFFMGFVFVASFYFLSQLRVFLFYALYQLFFILYFLSSIEFLHFFLHPYLPDILIGRFSFFNYQAAVVLFYAGFTFEFFGFQRKKHIKVNTFYNYFRVIILSTIFFGVFFNQFFGHQNWFHSFLNLLGLVLIVFVSFCVFFGVRERRPGAASYLWAQSPILVSIIILSGSNLGLIPKNQDHTTLFGVSFLIENILMLFALALLLRQYFKEKEKMFTTEIVEALENERHQIAMNLHDELGGTLATIKRRIENIIDTKVIQSSLAQEFNKVLEMVKSSSVSLRRISHNLAPTEFQRLGLIKSLEHLCNASNNSNFEVVFYKSGKTRKLSMNIEINLYRIVTEALQNTHKHSGASHVEISLNFFENELNLMISDNGLWKEPKYDGMGLKNIKLRVKYLNGKFHIDSNSSGTCMTVELKLI